MKILAIDYGKSKIGIAFADTKIAEPYCVLRYKTEEEAIIKIIKIINVLGVEKVVVGISEGKSAENAKNFAEDLLKKELIDLDYVDETLSTVTAQDYSIEAGIKRSKRRLMEDAYAATVMLQWYIEKNV